MKYNSTLADLASAKQPFFKMTAHLAKEDYKAKLITAEAYVLYIIKASHSPGWKWTFDPKEFCKEWEIPKSTFYRVISNLKAKGKINWETSGTITVWHSTDIGMNETVSPTNSKVSLTHETASPTNETDSLMSETAIPIHETEVPLLRLKSAETLVVQFVHEPTDIKQIDTDSTESVSISNSDGGEQTGVAPCGGASPAASIEKIRTVAAGDGQPINYFVTPGFDPVTAERPQVKLPFLRDREARLKRIKAAMNCGEFPGFQFLVESMQDVKLRGEIQRLLAKYPEWRVAIIDQQLIQFDSA